MYVLLPPFGVAIRGKWHSLQLVALGIPYSANTKVRCDPGFSLDTFYINKCNFCYPFLPLLGVLLGVKATLRLLPLVIPYSGTLRYDMTLVLEFRFYINTCQFCYHFILPLFGLRWGVQPNLGYLHWSVRARRSLRYAMSVILTLVLLHKWITILLPIFTHFGVAVRGKATLEMLALVIPYSENTIR